jgi:hypothetical protein
MGGGAVACRGRGEVKRERLAFLADNPPYTTAKFECPTNSGSSSSSRKPLHELRKKLDSLIRAEHGG